MNEEYIHPTLIEISDMAQLDDVSNRQVGCGYNAYLVHSSRVFLAMRVYIEGCQSSSKDSCNDCSNFLIKLCEFNDGKIDADE
jgi:hypothetical protein